jgi:hypothetical protein
LAKITLFFLEEEGLRERMRGVGEKPREKGRCEKVNKFHNLKGYSILI